jgi:hypothetical protein
MKRESDGKIFPKKNLDSQVAGILFEMCTIIGAVKQNSCCSGYLRVPAPVDLMAHKPFVIRHLNPSVKPIYLLAAACKFADQLSLDPITSYSNPGLECSAKVNSACDGKGWFRIVGPD